MAGKKLVAVAGRERAELAALIGGAERLRRIVEHQKVVRGGDCGDGVVIGRQAEQIDRNDGPRLKPEPLCGRDRALAARRIEIERLRLDVGHDRRGAAERDHFGGRAERESGTDHRIAGPDLPRHQHQKKRVGAARTGDRMARAAERRKFGLERAHLRSVDELAMREHAGDRVVDGAAEPAALRGDVDERDRPLVEAGMLIHHRFRSDPKVRFDRKIRFSSQSIRRHGRLADDAARPLALRRSTRLRALSRQRMAISRLATPSSPVTAGVRPLRMAFDEGEQLGAQRLGIADRQMPHRIAAVGLEAETFGDLERQQIGR